MSDEGVADDELASFIDRILRMKSEEDAIKSDIKEIYAEAKGRGYDKTRLGETVATVRKLEKDADGEAEKEAIRDLYLTAYFRAKNKAHAHAYARGDNSARTNPPVAPQPESDLTSPPSPLGQVAAIQPETAHEAGDDLVTSPVTAADHGEVVNGNGATQRNPGGENGQVTSALIETLPVASQASGLENDRDETRADASDMALGSAVELSAPLSFADRIKKLRPLCQQPNSCRSSGGKNHCYVCMKASNEAGAA